SYTSTETATGSEPTKPATKNTAPKEVIARVHHRTQGGEFHRSTLGNSGERRQHLVVAERQHVELAVAGEKQEGLDVEPPATTTSSS
ncbi:MAG TPA: hypothetical protein VK070_03130, partial [Acidimicrobiia bacterium]|nr:hypothetical protein [Acidimicrobiia bacterium]